MGWLLLFLVAIGVGYCLTRAETRVTPYRPLKGGK